MPRSGTTPSDKLISNVGTVVEAKNPVHTFYQVETMPILQHILADLRERKDISSVQLADFYLCSPFTVVLLSDGSVGSAGNYDVQNCTDGYHAAQAKKRYERVLHSDPLLLHTLQNDRSLVGQSLLTAILSALSQDSLTEPVLNDDGLKIMPAANWLLMVRNLLRDGDTVKMIGYGGALPMFCASRSVRRLHVCDFTFRATEYRDIAWREIKGSGFDCSRVTLSGGESDDELSQPSDIYFITGSALCNGTMDKLLQQSNGCREVIVQGPSCSVFPLEFFRRSVTLLLTTTKSRSEFEAGRHTGDEIYRHVDRIYVAISNLNQHGGYR